ncbi:MAG: SUMF1/EgtB/PvdO family nonheme iron enzyme [Planctomycetota bacterium]
MRALAPLAALLLLGACGGGGGGERLLFELERMAFVSPGRCDWSGPTVIEPTRVRAWSDALVRQLVERAPGLAFLEEVFPPFERTPVCDDLVVRAPLLVDRFEASRDDWRHYTGAAPAADGLDDPFAATSEDRWAWPAFCDLDEARAYAEARSMRLLSAAEWMYVAAGTSFHRYPWGRDRSRSVANTLDLGLARPVGVGTFERGRTGSGCYDLVGNAMEWVEGSLPPYSSLDWSGPQGPSAMGGSYLHTLKPLHAARSSGPPSNAVFDCVPLPPHSRSVDLGVRCAIEAEAFLRERLPALSRASSTRERLVRVGALWGRAAQPLLERLLAERPGDFALSALVEGARR